MSEIWPKGETLERKTNLVGVLVLWKQKEALLAGANPVKLHKVENWYKSPTLLRNVLAFRNFLRANNIPYDGEPLPEELDELRVKVSELKTGHSLIEEILTQFR